MVVRTKENNLKMIMDVHCGALFRTSDGYYILTNQVIEDTYCAVNVENGRMTSFNNGQQWVEVIKGAEIIIPV